MVKKKIMIVLFLMIPIVLQIFWQIENHELPISDAGDHYRIAYLLFYHFRDGFLNGIISLFHSNGKPILFSVYAAPLIYLKEQFSDLAPVATFQVLLQVALVASYFWLFSYKIDLLFSSLLTAMITLSPFIFSLMTSFMPENVWHLFFVVFLGALLRANNLKNGIYSFLAGIFLALSILARPAESLLIYTPGLVVYLVYLVIEKEISSIKAIIFCSILIISSMTTLYLSICGYSFIYFLCIMLAATISFIKINHSKTLFAFKIFKNDNFDNDNVYLFIIPLLWIVNLWVFFYAHNIYVWSFDNSFGNGAKVNDQVNITINIFSILAKILMNYGPLMIGSLVTLVIISLYTNSTILFKNARLFYVLICLLLMFLPITLAYSWTGTSDDRRILPCISFLVVVLAFVAHWIETRKIILRSLSYLLLFFTILAQSYVIIMTANHQVGVDKFALALERIIGSHHYREPGENISHDKEIIKKIISLGITNSKIAVYSLGMFSKKMYYQAESLRFITLSYDPTLSFFAYWGYTDYEPYHDVIDRLYKNSYDYILLDNLENPIVDPILKKRLRSHTFFIEDMLNLIKKYGADNIDGLKLISAFNIGERVQYLYKIKNPNGVKITASSQLLNYSPEGLLSAREPGWHSISNPKYPQWIKIQFSTSMYISEVGLLPQQGLPERAPKTIVVEGSNDGINWFFMTKSDALCVSNSQVWSQSKFNQAMASWIRINILENCGSPDLITLRGVYIK